MKALEYIFVWAGILGLSWLIVILLAHVLMFWLGRIDSWSDLARIIL